jgi:uncharacterized membrane protein YhhN
VKTTFLILYFLFGLIHLYHSWKDDKKHRNYTKPLLLSTLAVFYVVSATDISWVLLLALVTSWLGDVLLIPKGHKWFVRGGIFFLISHVLFMAVYFPNLRLSAVPWVLLVVLAPVYYGASLKIMKEVAPTTPKSMVKPMGMYLMTNSTMNLLALSRMFSLQTVGSVVAYVGAVLFFVSDCTLFLVRYYRKPEIIFKKHFTVMTLYLSGQFFITLGILMQ